MPKFATAADSLTTALAVVDSRLREIDINEQLELYLELINRRAAIQQAIGVTLSGDITIDNVAITSSALPTGASTSALQSSIQADAGSDASKAISIQGITNGKAIPVTANAGTNLNTSALALESGGNLAGINTKIPSGLTISSTRLLTDGSGVTQPVSAASLPLPTGAATSANQSTANSSLGSLDGKLTLGAKTAANSLAVTLATDGVASGIDAKIGEVQASPTANTVLARLKAIADSLVFGIKTAANSISITPASDAVFSVTQAPTTPAFLFTSTITRAANTTAYTANDTYGAAFELVSSPAPTSGQWVLITDIEIIFNITALPSGMAGFHLYTYGVTPPSAVADNGAFSVPSGDRSAIIFPNGISLGSATLARGGGSVVAQANNINVACKLTGTSLFAYLVTIAAFTPAANSETATIRVRALAL